MMTMAMKSTMKLGGVEASGAVGEEDLLVGFSTTLASVGATFLAVHHMKCSKCNPPKEKNRES